MEREYKNLPTEISIKDIMSMANLRGTGSTIGPTAVFSRATLSMDYVMEKANGNGLQDLLILTTAITRMTRNGDTVSLLGQVATSTKASMKQIKEMDSVKCTG
jgi:hypothetical protein